MASRRDFRSLGFVVLVALLSLVAAPPAVAADESALPDAKPVPDVQVLPLPYGQASFQHLGRELTRFHFGPAVEQVGGKPTMKRPFLYPLVGPEGPSLTRMGHPHDPVTHSHHNSVWISHHDVAGVDFWSDAGTPAIVCENVLQYADGPTQAWMLALNTWRGKLGGKVLMVERRRIAVEPLAKGDWLMLVDLQFEAPGREPVTLGQTPFGMIGVRMAKTIGVHDGGGRILNSEGQINEEEVFRKPARWVDYSGRVTDRATGGITLMDHPANPNHPAPFHVRGDGWMGACLTLDEARVIEPGKPLRLRYGLWMHAGVSGRAQADRRWSDFAGRELPTMDRVR